MRSALIRLNGWDECRLFAKEIWYNKDVRRKRGDTDEEKDDGGAAVRLSDAGAASGETADRLVEVEYKKADLDAGWNMSDVVPVVLEGRRASIGGGGARMDGSVLVITGEGDYLLSGELTGRIEINAGKNDKVRLILNGLTITSTDSAAIFISKADKATITLADGSQNIIVSGANRLWYEEEELDAAIYSKADLVVNGGGSLTVDAQDGHGILSKDDLRMIGGMISVSAAADGVRGRDAILFRDGSIRISAGGDGMKSNNDEEADRGYISIDGGRIEILAGEDGIQAETSLQIVGGEVIVAESYEGIEAQYMLISGGTVSVTSAEDGLNAAGGDTSAHPMAVGNQMLRITGGVVRVNAGGDGIDSNGAIRFEGGEVYVSGPVDRGNGALDASGDMAISGGILMAAGSVGMETAPVPDGQAVSVVYPSASQPGGQRVSVRDAAGEEMAAFVPQKDWACIVVSVPGLQVGEKFSLYVGDALLAEAEAGSGLTGSGHRRHR